MIRKSLFSLALLGALCAFLFVPVTAHAAKKRRYTKAQVQQAIKKAGENAIQRALKKSKRLRKLKKRRKQLRLTLKKGFCRTTKIRRRKKGKRRKKRKKRTYCVRYKGKKTAVYINGKHKPVLSALGTAARTILKELEKGLNKAQKEFKELGKKIKKLTRQIKKKAGAAFKLAIQKFRKRVRKEAKKIVGTWKEKILKKIATLVKKQLPKAYAMTKPKTRDKLLKVLKGKKNYKAVKRVMRAKMTAAKAAKAYAKTAIAAIALVVATQALSVTYACWKFSGSKKRNCLNKELPPAVKFGIFRVVSALVGAAIDLSVIEPLSHSLAAAVSSALAAATAGVGAAAYPVVWLISSVTMNLAVFAILEFGIKKVYSNLYNKHLSSKAKRGMRSLVARLPEKILKCWGPKKMCVN